MTNKNYEKKKINKDAYEYCDIYIYIYIYICTCILVPIYYYL